MEYGKGLKKAINKLVNKEVNDHYINLVTNELSTNLVIIIYKQETLNE